MAVDHHLPSLTLVSATSTSSSLSPVVTRRRRFVQVGANNSSAFISFPTNSRQSSVFVPTYRLRTSLSTPRPFSRATNAHSVSNNSKSSNTASSSIVSADHERKHSQQKCNPILNNSLLNHRKEQPKSLPIKTSIDFSQTTSLCPSLKTISNDKQISTIRVSTTHLVIDEPENSISDEQIIPDSDKDNEREETHYLDQNKYDYITRWLHAVEQATHFKGTILKKKRSKNRFVQS